MLRKEGGAHWYSIIDNEGLDGPRKDEGMPLVDVQDDKGDRNRTSQQGYTVLYDPPVDGETPKDGEGKPRSSVIHNPDVESKLARGFTVTPVGAPPPAPKAPPPTPRRRRAP